MCGKLEKKFTHANVQGLSEILNSTERTCSLKISGFLYVWKSLIACRCNINAFGFLRLVTFSEEQTNLTVCPRGRIERCWKDSRSAKHVFWSNFVLILWKLFGLLSFGFSFGSWFGREVELTLFINGGRFIILLYSC